MFEEFKKFALRGNAVDMAVGIIIGAAFGKIVTSLVNDIIMPPIGLLVGNVDFSSFVITLKEKTAETAAVTLNYGAFINTVLDFLIIAFCIFILIKQMNKLTKKDKKSSKTKECPFCLTEVPFKAQRCSACTSELA